MKVGYFADGPWSHKALELVATNKDLEIAFIVPRYDTQDPVLRDWAERLQVDFIPIKNVNHPDSIEKFASYNADIFVSMSFNQILKKDIIELTPNGFINCHAGALPFYRGRNILNWVLINDEKEFGVTVHYIDEGIDTGDIILQSLSPIDDTDDYKSLLDRSILLCADLLYESLILIKNGNAPKIPQDSISTYGFYCSRRRIGDECINWNWSSRRIFNFIRAITNPGPCARTMHKGTEIILESSKMISNATDYMDIPGAVVGRTEDGSIIKTGDSVIIITGVLDANSKLEHVLRIGDRLKSKT